MLRQYLMLLATIVLFNASCHFAGKRVKGNGDLTTEQRDVTRATKIRVVGPMDVELQKGATGVRVEADENLMKHIITKMDDGWLVIRLKRNVNVKSDHPIKVYVSTPTITDIDLAGSGNVTAKDQFFGDDDITLEIAGSGNMHMDVDAPKVNVEIAGSGTLNISGATRDVNIDIAGSGAYNGYALKAENVVVDIAGSGDANVYAALNLKANLLGSGNVHFKGNPTVTKHVMGSGSIAKTH